MTKNTNGPGIDALQRAANAAQQKALDSLDRVNDGKRAAAKQTTDGVTTGVLETAKKSVWIETDGF